MAKQEYSPSASNRLYHGECRTFDDAMTTLAAAFDREIAFCELCRREGQNVGEMPDRLKRDRKTAFRALEEWKQKVRSVELELARQWQESADEQLRLIGEALEEGDYSKLAL